VTTINPESDDYFKTLDKGGGPTDVLYSFQEAVEIAFKDYWDEEDIYYKPIHLSLDESKD